MPFSVVLVMTSIGRNIHCPTYTHLAGQNNITSPHDGGKNRQARDLCDSTHSLRHIASVCVPCCWFFFQSAGKSQFQHLFRDTVVKAWQTPPIELQCDSTLTSSYQASISYLPSESADVFPLLSCSSQQADENSATLPKNSLNVLPTAHVGFMRLCDQPSPCGGPFCAWMGAVIPQTNFILISVRPLG